MGRWARTAVAVGAGITLLASGALALADDGQGQAAGAGYGATALGYNPGFTDMSQVPWAVPAVDALAQQCVVQGVGTRQFDPTGLTTRAQMAVLIDRLMGLGAPGAAPGPAGTANLFGASGNLNLQALLGPGSQNLAGVNLQALLGGTGGPGGPASIRHPGPPLVPPGLARRDGSRKGGLRSFLRKEKKLLREASKWAQTQRKLAQKLRAHFRDYSRIPSWALPSVQLAYDAGILVGEQQGQFAPSGSVTWAQAALITERIFQLPAVSAQQVAAELQQLPQGTATPAWAQQAVADLVAAGVFSGTLVQNYSPMQPIDRADLAVLLQNAEAARAGGQVSRGAQLAMGRVVALGASSLSVLTGCGVVNVPLASGAPVYQGGQTTSLSAVTPGDVVLVGLNAGQGIFVDVLSSPAAPLPVPMATGLLVAVGQDAITVQESNQTSSFTLAPGVTVAGQVTSVGALMPGDAVVLTLNAQGQVTAIDVSVVPQSSTVSGTVQTVASSQITVTTASGSPTFSLASGVSVSGQASALNQVASGDQVTLTLGSNGQVTAIDVTAAPQSASLAGTVQAVNSSQITVATANSGSLTFAVAPAVSVSGQASALSGVASGDQVTLTLGSNDQVTTIDVTAVPQSSTVTGTVQAISGSQITVATASSGSLTFNLASSVTVSGQAASVAAIIPGDAVTLALAGNGQVTAIDVTAVPQSSTVTGTVQAVSGSQIAVETASGGSLTFNLTSSTTVSGQASSVSAVVPGDTVTLTLAGNGQVTAVDVTAVPQSSTVSGTVQAVSGSQITVATSGGSRTFAIAASLAVSGQASSLSAVIPGDQVTLTVNASGAVTAVDVTSAAATSTLSGTVSALQAQALSLTATGAQGILTYTFTIASGVRVSVQGASGSMADVQVGDQATLTLDTQGQVSAINVTSAPAAASTVAGTLIAAASQGAPNVTFATYAASSGTFQLQTVNLVAGATVTLSGGTSSLSALRVGDALTVGLDASGQAVSISATPLPASDVSASGVVDINSNAELGVYTTGSGAHQVTLPDGSSPLALAPSGSSDAIVAMTSVTPGTAVTVYQNAVNGDSLLLIEQ